MKINRLYVVFIPVLFFLIAGEVYAELSVTNKWRISEAADACQRTTNALMYTEYWQDTVTDENKETVCMAEQFAHSVVVTDGEKWLDNKAVGFINQCKEKSEGNDWNYYQCLEAGLKQITRELSAPCQELGAEGLWEEQRCRRLVSFIFVKKFDDVMKESRPLFEKVTDIKILKLLFSPLAAIIFLVLFVLDVVILTDPGNWMGISGFGFVIGTIILVAYFLPYQIRFLMTGCAVIISLGAIVWNHLKGMFKEEE